MTDDTDDFGFEREWRFDCEWFGWRRMLWLSAAIDFQYMQVHVVLFGLALSYGKKIKRVSTFTTN